MKKIDKIYERAIMTYVFLLIITVIIKLLGGNYFQVNINNHSLIILDNIINTLHLSNLWYAISMYINVYIIASITINDNSKRLKLFILLTMPLVILMQVLKTGGNIIFLLIDLVYLAIIPLIYCLKYKDKKYSIKNYLCIVIIINLVQMFSIIIRDAEMFVILGGDFIANFIYNLDFLLILLIIYKYYFLERREDLCGMVVSFGSHLLQALKTLPKKLRDYYIRNSRLSNEEKVEKAVYIPLIILFNLFTLSCIVLIAVLNGAFIEAIYITVSFWINKTAFGKPYHAETVAKCFIISSLSYFCLTRITTEIGVSIFVPIILGIALSYVTSLLVKDKYEKKLYKGMPEEDLYKIVGLVTNNELEKKMLKEYYCDRMTQTAVAMRNNYSISSFEKKKKKILDRLKEV